MDFQTVESVALGFVEAGGGPGPDGFLKGLREILIVQVRDGILCARSKSSLAAQIFGFIGIRVVGAGRRARRSTLIALGRL